MNLFNLLFFQQSTQEILDLLRVGDNAIDTLKAILENPLLKIKTRIAPNGQTSFYVPRQNISDLKLENGEEDYVILIKRSKGEKLHE
jgi:hypothetical protein